MADPTRAQFASLMQDTDLLDEIRDRAAQGRLSGAARLGLSGDDVLRALDPRPRGAPPRPGAALESVRRPPVPPAPGGALEAIVSRTGRPTLLVQNGSFELPESRIWRTTLDLSRSNIERAIARTGRIELSGHMLYDWIGTGWLVDEGILCTNRHVAVEFATGDTGTGFVFKTNFLGDAMRARVDLRAEHQSAAAFEIRVEEILWISPQEALDIAFLRVATDLPLPDPLPLKTAVPAHRAEIGTVGYPGFDSRNARDALRDLFNDIYDVKRFAPGKVSYPPEAAQPYFIHDCTTLGGASGSAVFDLDDGGVVGLHFSGMFEQGNFAVKAAHVAQALADLTTSVAVPPMPPAAPEAVADGRHGPDVFLGRDGYDSGFLDEEVPLPGVGDWTVTRTADGKDRLDYQHFSVVMSAERKLPLLSAVNIDGRLARRVFRHSDRWFIDDRIPEAAQLGNEIYRHNDLDRGHMVRRLDPVWGDAETAGRANDDTFHYVNAAPQHRDLNQRIWRDLEDMLLDRARAKDLRLSVFTGPVLGDSDRLYRELVRLPQAFWKVAVAVDAQGSGLIAAGFVLGQGEMIADIHETPFALDRFETFQVPVGRIAELTGLDFGDLAARDVLRRDSRETRGLSPLNSPDDLLW